MALSHLLSILSLSIVTSYFVISSSINIKPNNENKKTRSSKIVSLEPQKLIIEKVSNENNKFKEDEYSEVLKSEVEDSSVVHNSLDKLAEKETEEYLAYLNQYNEPMSTQKEDENKIKTESSSELVFYDYSIDKQEPKKQIAPKISEVLAQFKKETKEEERYSTEDQNLLAGLTKMANPQTSSLWDAKMEDNDSYSEVRIIADSYQLDSKKLSQPIQDFDVEFYDNNEIISSGESGDVIVDNLISSGKGTRLVTIWTKNHIPLNTEIVIEKNEGIELNFPIIETESFLKILKEEGINKDAASVMIELGEARDAIISTENVSVKLDENLDVIEQDSTKEATYILFLGINPGTVLVEYIFENNIKAHKAVIARQGEITFDGGYFEDREKQKVSFSERGLFSNQTSDFSIDPEDIIEDYIDTNPSKIGLNSFQFDFGKFPIGANRYVEFKDNNYSPLISISEVATKIEVPSQDFIDSILKRFELEEMGDQCIIQVNLKDKKIISQDLNYLGTMDTEKKSYAQVMNLGFETMALDKDGKFYDDAENSEKLFVRAEGSGVVTIAIHYADKTSDYFKSFCMPGAYVVESLVNN